MKARKTWNDVFQALEHITVNSHCYTQQNYQLKKTRAFHDKSKVKKFITTKPTLQKILEVILQSEEKDKLIIEATEKQNKTKCRNNS